MFWRERERERRGVVTREWNNMVIIVCLGRVGKEMRGGGKKKEDRQRGSVCPRRSRDGMGRARRRKAI